MSAVRVVAVQLVCILLFPYWVHAQVNVPANTVVNQIRSMKTAVVQIRYTSNAPREHPPGVPPVPDTGARAGTGFFVSSQGYVLTAGHVIREPQGAVRTGLIVGISLDPSSVPGVNIRGGFQWIGATVVDVDDIHDLALLKLSQNPFKGEVKSAMVINGVGGPKPTTARLGSKLPYEGENLLVSGYPLEIPTLVTQRGMVASLSYQIVEVPESRGPMVINRPEAVNSVLLDAVVNPGNSGGPVYDSESGEVFGICEAYETSPLFTSARHKIEVTPGEVLTQNSGLAVVIPVDYAIKLLRKNGVSDFSMKRSARTATKSSVQPK